MRRNAEAEFPSWLEKVRNKYRVTKVRSIRERKKSLLIKNIPCDVSLRDLYVQFRTFGVVKDVCVTERPSANQSDRHKKHQRLAIVEFQRKWSVEQFLQKKHPFF